LILTPNVLKKLTDEEAVIEVQLTEKGAEHFQKLQEDVEITTKSLGIPFFPVQWKKGDKLRLDMLSANYILEEFGWNLWEYEVSVVQFETPFCK